MKVDNMVNNGYDIEDKKNDGVQRFKNLVELT